MKLIQKLHRVLATEDVKMVFILKYGFNMECAGGSAPNPLPSFHRKYYQLLN